MLEYGSVPVESESVSGGGSGALPETDNSEEFQNELELDWRMIRVATLHFFALAMHEFGRSEADLRLFAGYICKQYQITLSTDEEAELLRPFKENKVGKDRETLIQKYKRLQLEAAIEHDFDVARAISDIRPGLRALVESEVANMLAAKEDTGLEMDLAGEARARNEAFSAGGVDVPAGWEVKFV